MTASSREATFRQWAAYEPFLPFVSPRIRVTEIKVFEQPHSSEAAQRKSAARHVASTRVVEPLVVLSQ